MFLRYISHPKLIVFFVLGLFVILFGTGLFMIIEGWSFVDAMYFTVSTITTVGYGDLVPTHNASKILATIYMILLVPTILIGVGVVAEIVQERRRWFFNRD